MFNAILIDNSDARYHAWLALLDEAELPKGDVTVRALTSQPAPKPLL
jgi:hypothetical protein